MPVAGGLEGSSPGRGLGGAWTTFRLALGVRRDPVPFCRYVSEGVPRYLQSRDVALRGARVLDAGAGGGALCEALAAAGARAVGLDVRDYRRTGLVRTPFALGRAQRLPFRSEAFDVVVSSNVLEHVPDPWAMVDELIRVCRDGGHVWLSWTNWLSPIGGHEMSPFHYLGPDRGLRTYRRLRRKDPPWNVPGSTLFVANVGPVLRGLRALGGVTVTDVAPRYWPSLRFLAGVPGLREVAMWNCTILLEVRRSQPLTRPPGGRDGPSPGGTDPER